MKRSGYLVGIDLGTTHTVVAYAPQEPLHPPIELLPLAQLVAPGEVAERLLLPSFRYHPAPGELRPQDLRLPWPGDDPYVAEAVLGTLARELGARVPGRLVASAKSWLSHRAVDRTAPILPWGGPDPIPRVSPVDASASYLAYVRAAWNARFPDAPLERQEVVLTVPASFDEEARLLTVEAARQAGLPHCRLLEEPQAAFYDFIARHGAALPEVLAGVRLALVCDVGGGTTDLTLIRVEGAAGEPSLTRVGVGNHLMLGGDNMDLALAHLAEARLTEGGARLDAGAMAQLTQQCRLVKERLLAPDAPESATVTVLGAGARLVGGARSTRLMREEVQRLILDGFFPLIPADARPQRVRGGIVEFGLPYAADPAITRHVAAFLARHEGAAREALEVRAGADEALLVPDAVLLNGGVFRSQAQADRLLEALQGWRGGAVRRLDNPEPELAVARGAVAYALARLGRGVRIGGGSARSYFLALDGAGRREGVCLLPKGTPEGEEVRLAERTFLLRLGRPVSFRLASVNADAPCRPGELSELTPEEVTDLPPLHSVVRAGEAGEIPVQLAARLTEVGTLELQCVSLEREPARWGLEFQLRGARAPLEGVDAEAHLGRGFAEAVARLGQVFGGRSEAREAKRLRGELERHLGPRERWETPLLRDLFEPLMEGARRRRRSPEHERVWLNFTGFCLRPGFGYPLDDWRVAQVWALFAQGLQFAGESQGWSEWWTLWRRLAGGLDARAQQALWEEMAFDLQPPGKGARRRPPGPKRLGHDDMVRLVGSLERLPVERKVETGEWLLARLAKPSENLNSWWAVGRLGARQPFYASAHAVVPAPVAAGWLERILALEWRTTPQLPFAAAQLARLTGDRQRDLEPALRQRVAERLRRAKAPEGWTRMVTEVVELEAAEQRQVLGESLPPGLRLAV